MKSGHKRLFQRAAKAIRVRGSELKVEQIERLTGIIADKGWANFDFLAHPSKSIYDALIEMLKHLPNLERGFSLSFRRS